VTGPRRLSHAISDGDGISLIVSVRGPDDARRAEAAGAGALLAEGELEAIRAVSGLPIVTAGTGGDARIVRSGDDDVELGDGVELVVEVAREEELEEALERLDPELFVLAAGDVDPEERLERLLELLADVPAGKLAIADLREATQEEIDELERAGVDAVLVRGGAT
jgi:hypothetical protein